MIWCRFRGTSCMGRRASGRCTCGDDRACDWSPFCREAARSAASGAARYRPLYASVWAAADVALKELPNDMAHVERLSERLMAGIRKHVPEVVLNGHATQRHAGNVNLSFAYVEGESLLMSLKNIAGKSRASPRARRPPLEPSYVLRAIGVSEDLALLRAAPAWVGAVHDRGGSRLRDFDQYLRVHVARLRGRARALWELVQEGADRRRSTGRRTRRTTTAPVLWTTLLGFLFLLRAAAACIRVREQAPGGQQKARRKCLLVSYAAS